MKRLLAIVLLFALSAPAQFTVPMRTGAIAVAPSSGGTTVTDDFNRADGALGSNWTDWTGQNKLAIASNRVHATAVWASNGIAFYTGANFGNDQWAQITVSNFTAGNADGIVLIVRATQNGTAWSGYAAKCAVGSCVLLKCTNSTNAASTGCTSILSGAASAVANGDVLKLSVTGNSLTLTKNGTNYNISYPFTDSTSPFTSGRVGIGVQRGNGSDIYGDDFSAGPMQ